MHVARCTVHILYVVCMCVCVCVWGKGTSQDGGEEGGDDTAGIDGEVEEGEKVTKNVFLQEKTSPHDCP